VELVRFMRDPSFGLWQSLRDTIRDGKTGVGSEAMDKTEVELARAFHNGAYAMMTRVAEILDIEFSDYSRILDLGSHTGAGALCLARRYPNLRATIRDKAIFKPLAEEYFRQMKLEDRVCFLPGDPDEAQPDAEYDLVLLPLHLSRRGRAAIPGILANVLKSLRSGGHVLVTEFLLEESRAEPREAALFRLNVLATYGPSSAGALTRSELCRLLQEANFSNVDMVGLPMFGVTAITATKS
jgi:predicted O-methyltransferase YrrM